MDWLDWAGKMTGVQALERKHILDLHAAAMSCRRLNIGRKIEIVRLRLMFVVGIILYLELPIVKEVLIL